MRAPLVAVALGTMLVASGARAQCDADAGCRPVFNLTVSPLPQSTTAPLLDINAILQDNGAVFVNNPNATVFVTVFGSGADGGGAIPLPDGGVSSSGSPFTTPLSLVSFDSAQGIFTSVWDGGTSLFLGNNVVIVSAVKPSGLRVDSTPQTVRLDLSLGGDGGTTPDGGISPDGGITPDGGTTPDGGISPDGGFLPDGGTNPGALTIATSGDSSQGCTTAGREPPSFLLMALAVMLAGLGRRAMRG